jgi:N-glycosylase/DNA lyase
MALHGRLISLRQDPEYLHYRAIYPQSASTLATPPRSSPASGVGDGDDTLDLLKHYLNLGPNLGELYEQWASADLNFKKKAPKFTGVRILKQDAWEALVGFICSSNNNIARISQMVHKLCTYYGPLIGHLDGEAYHDFPRPKALTGKKVEQHLRELGFGYRAKYLHQTAVMVEERGLDWLDGLRNPESPVFGQSPAPAGELIAGGRKGYRKAHEQLLELQGVGPKVADCVCLMGLGWGEAVPVDTHVWQIAQRDYKFGKGKHSSLTKATYDAVANKFRALWGKEAGWAHSVLFTADLKTFSQRLVEKVEVADVKSAIKTEGEIVTAEVVKQETTVVCKRIKEESEEHEHQVLEITARSVRATKRRRKA